ncbi:MAG: anti-sigma factor [Dehalococcoidia bacterium]|nr:anti-sigma factor [Dehalococcoidia bacterium]
MNCAEVGEILDAYALGAAEKAEADSVERHISDCVRCWEELNRAQRATALLALAIPMRQAPQRVQESILAQIAREGRPASGGGPGLLQRFRLNWQMAAGALGAAGVAALAFAAFLQMQVSDLRDERSDLAGQVQAADAAVQQQQQLLAVLTASDAQQVTMKGDSLNSDASVVYNWSRAARKGFLACNGLPPLAEDQVYQVWFSWDDTAQSLGTFRSGDGTCQLPMDLKLVQSPPKGIGVTAEQAGGSEQPSSKWLLYAHFDR